MKTSFKNRVLALFLSVLMLVTMVPMVTVPASAATTKDFSGCTVADLGFSVTDATGSGNVAPVEASWVAMGTNITGSLVGAQGKGSGFAWRGYYYESTTTLTLTNNKKSEAELSFKYSVTTAGSAFGDITVNGTKYTSSVADKSVSVTLAAGASVKVVLHVPERKKAFSMPDPNGASITISDIKLVGQGGVTISFASDENGSYTVQNATASTAVTVPGSVTAKSTDRFTMTATPATGYVFAGWYNVTTGKYLSADLTYTTLFEKDSTVTAKFMKQSDGVYGVGSAVFTDLTAAAQAAEFSSEKTVVLLKNATITGSHTIPMGVTLLIPYDAAHTLSKAVPVSETVNHSSTSAENYVKYEKPSAFRTLTMTDGSELIIEGEMSVNAKHESCVGGQIYGGQVLGKYGEIKMNGNSKITVKNGATVYAWGYIWGSGSVEALSGATIYEKMQVTDYRGGSNTSTIALRNGWGKSDGAFPFNQYYIQNIEVKEILHEGAKLMAHAAVNLSGETPAEAAVEFIGSSSAMFTVQGAVITKEYHPETDRLSLSVDGDENSYCEINGMKLSMGTLSIDSANYTLPINSNIDININAGTAVVNQELVLQPGVKVVVGSDAMLVNNANVYIMDLDQWGAFVFSGKRQQAVVYTPSLNKASTRTINSDAVMDINGYVMPIAGVYTTAGGAQIISSEKTGVIEFYADAASDSTVAQLTGGTDVNKISVTSAKLKNGGLNGTTFVETKGSKEGAVYGYCSNCDVWADENHVCTVKYEITWKDKDGKTIYSTEVEEGTTPVFNNNNYITIPKGHSLVYTPAIVKATANATYTVSVNPCVDTDKDHACDYGCGFTTSHSDENYDHICDFCKNSFSDHKDDDENCICDYSGCKKQLAHNPGTAVIENEVKPDCTNTGSYDNVTYCTVCGTVTGKETITVPALGHKEGSVVVENKVDADCENGGSYDNVTYCTVCNEELSRKTVTVSANGHAWDEGVIDPQPTCNDEGVKTFTCGTCGETKTEAVSALGHSNIIDVDAVAPTCTEAGLTAGKKCGVCDEFTEAQQEVPALGHTDGAVVVENEVKPDCTVDGSYDNVTYCTVCGEETSRETITVPALGHKAGEVVVEDEVEATCEDEGSYCNVVYCTVCNEELSHDTITVPALGHDMGALYKTVEPTCTENGEERSDCSRCDYYETFEIDPTGHEYNEVVTDPTCTEEGYTTYTCGTCGDTYTADEVTALGHNYDAVATAPTCTEEGYTTYTCSLCGDTYKDDIVKSLGHSWDEGVIDPDSTCNEEGTKTYTCEVCGDSYTEAVEAKGHGTTKGFTYDDNDDGTHAVICNDCNVTVETVEHKYGDDHKCVCDAVETFTVTLMDYNTEVHEFGTLEIPYGAKVLDYLKNKNVVVEDFEFANSYIDGVYSFSGDWYKERTKISEEFTMPGEDITLLALMNFTGWQHCGNDNWSYAIKDETQTGWHEIDGEWYYLNPEVVDSHKGLRARGITRVPYPTTAINGVTYEADKETLDYCQNKGVEFIDAESAFFVFDDDGKFNAVTGIVDGNRYALNGMIGWHPGLVEVNGDYYYFIGNVEKGGNTPANGDTYITRANGIEGFKQNDVYNFNNGKLSGYNGIVDGKYYVDSKRMDGNGLTAIEVNGETKYIYVRSTGEVVMNANYWIGSNDCNIVPGSYDFDANGYMLDVKSTKKNGVCYENGAYYFYEDGVRAYKGLIKYSGTASDGTVYENDWIYVRSNGQLATGTYWTTKNDSNELKSQNYNFDDFGKMIRTNGIIEENGNLYYYVNGVKQKCLGLIELDGKYYYVRTAGELVRGREYWITNVNDTGVVAQNYYFDSNGVMQNVVFDKDEAVNGVVDGYYYENGKVVCGAGLVELSDGSIIYVRSNGQLATGIYWPTTLNGILPAGKYDFGTDGRLVIE